MPRLVLLGLLVVCLLGIVAQQAHGERLRDNTDLKSRTSKSLLSRVKNVFWTTPKRYWGRKARQWTPKMKSAARWIKKVVVDRPIKYWRPPYRNTGRVGQRWSTSQKKSLKTLTRAWKRDLTKYIRKHRKWASKTLKLGGTLSNLESGLKFAFSGGGRLWDADLETGCLQTQAETFRVLSPLVKKMPGLRIRKMMVGKGLEHHAVVVFPTPKKGKGAAWKSAVKDGVVFDSWVYMKTDRTRTMKKWINIFYKLKHIYNPRFEL